MNEFIDECFMIACIAGAWGTMAYTRGAGTTWDNFVARLVVYAICFVLFIVSIQTIPPVTRLSWSESNWTRWKEGIGGYGMFIFTCIVVFLFFQVLSMFFPGRLGDMVADIPQHLIALCLTPFKLVVKLTGEFFKRGIWWVVDLLLEFIGFLGDTGQYLWKNLPLMDLIRSRLFAQVDTYTDWITHKVFNF